MILKLTNGVTKEPMLVETTSLVVTVRDNKDSSGNCCLFIAGEQDEWFICEETIAEIEQQIKEGGIYGN